MNMAVAHQYEESTLVTNAIADGYRIDYFDIEIVKELCGETLNIVVAKNDKAQGKAFILIADDKDTRWFKIKKALEEKKIATEKVKATPDAVRDMILGDDNESSKEGVGRISKSEQVLFQVLDDSKLERASDIHIHIEDGFTTIYYRIDGVMRVNNKFSGSDKLGHSIGRACFTTLAKVKGNQSSGDYAKEQTPLDATFNDNNGARWRAGLFPSDSGPRIVIRELGKKVEKVPDLTKLGFTAMQIAVIKLALRDGKGLLLITGPTSSGKSTTLSAIASLLNDGSRSIYSIEDPVERVIPGLAQASVDSAFKTGEVLAKQLLRQDPDVIIYGEFRTAEMVASGVRMSTTGHLCLGTFHTNGAIDTVLSLEGELGVSLYRLSNPGFLKASLYQELVSKPCPHCFLDFSRAKNKMSHFDVERIEKVLGGDINKLRFVNNGGCNKCGETGIHGKTVIAEVVPIDISACRYISERNILGWKEYLYKKRRWPNIRDHALEKIRAGEVDFFACENVVGSLTSDPLDDFDLEEIKRMAAYESQ
ncbi:GspE/PulE family protein [Aeromonas salmonicida]|uniref:GspE/PulE family protein n=1 Tax=Aeromonas salmonicida TaxID=645 RepID=UPI003D073B94